MMRLGYDAVVTAENQIWSLSIPVIDRWDLYTSLLSACGWTRLAFEEEQLKRIDRDWIHLIFEKENDNEVYNDSNDVRKPVVWLH